MRKEDEFNVVKITNEDENLNFEFGNTPNSESASYKENSDRLRDEINDNPTSNGTKRIKKEEKRRRKEESTKKDSKPSPESSISSSTATVSTVVGASLVTVATLSTLVGINVFFNGKCNMNIVEPSVHSIFYELDLTDIKDDKCIIKLEYQSYSDSQELVEGPNSGEFIDLNASTQYHVSVIDITYNNYILFEDNVSTKEEIIPPIETYTVTFVTDGGSEVESQVVNAGELIEAPTDPTKENYTFDGWYSDSDFTNEYDFNTPVNSDLTLYAHWMIKIYTVTFVTNGGSEIAEHAVNSGETIIRPTDPTKEHCTFEGWFIDPELTQEYDFSTPVTEDISLYAKWEDIPLVEINFESEGGTGTQEPGSQYVGEEYILPECTYTAPSGYVFDYWAHAGSDITYNPGDSYLVQSVAPITFIAIWAEAATIEFYPNGAEASVISIQVAIGKEYEIPSGDDLFTAPTYKEFDYWFDDMESVSRYSGDVITIEDTSYYLTAHWKYLPDVTFTVTFDSNGGSDVDPQVVNGGEYVTKPDNPTRDGYTFKGWYANAELTDSYNFFLPVTSDFTLYAKWELTYTVSFNSNGGSGTMDAVEVHSSVYTLPDSEFIPGSMGKKFVGWKINNEGDTIEADTEIDIDGDITLYAQWGTASINTYSPSGFSAFKTSIGTESENKTIGIMTLEIGPSSYYDSGQSALVIDNSYFANTEPFSGCYILNVIVQLVDASDQSVYISFGKSPMLGEVEYEESNKVSFSGVTANISASSPEYLYFNISTHSAAAIKSITVNYYV